MAQRNDDAEAALLAQELCKHLQVGALSDAQLPPGSVAQPTVMDEQETCRR